MIKRPMLAATVEDMEALRYPLLASPKLDGIRCLIIAGKALTRSFKPIPNNYIRYMLESRQWYTANPLECCDGEIMLAKFGASFQEVSSAVMSRSGEPNFVFHVFDTFGATSTPFTDRLAAASKAVGITRQRSSMAKLVRHTLVRDAQHLAEVEARWLKQGYEGVMLRDPDGVYKCGRSTLKEGGLMKLKRFEHGEAVIIGFEEQMVNTNTPKTDELGRAKRSTHAAGKAGKGTLGAFVVQPRELWGKGPSGNFPGVFNIGGGDGLTAELRRQIWNNRASYEGKIVRYRWQAHGTKDAPRIPQFEGFRDARDL